MVEGVIILLYDKPRSTTRRVDIWYAVLRLLFVHDSVIKLGSDAERNVRSLTVGWRVMGGLYRGKTTRGDAPWSAGVDAGRRLARFTSWRSPRRNSVVGAFGGLGTSSCRPYGRGTERGRLASATDQHCGGTSAGVTGSGFSLFPRSTQPAPSCTSQPSILFTLIS